MTAIFKREFLKRFTSQCFNQVYERIPCNLAHAWVKVFSFRTEFCFEKKNCYNILHIKYS